MKIISDTEQIKESDLMQMLNGEGTNYTLTIYGLKGLSDFMYQEGFVAKKLTLKDMCWEEALSTIGQRSGTPGMLEKAQERGK
jgi:hypothetical protein